MRFLSSAAILCSGLSFLVSASSLDQRTVAADVCVELNVALQVPLLGTKITIGDLEACICLSAVESFVKENALCLTASLLIGEEEVISIVTDLINSNNPQSCEYPDNAVPTCQVGNPCGFSCTNGYSFNPPSQCICKAPFNSCNGKCVIGSCPSSLPYAKRDNLNAGTTNNLSKRSMSLCPLGYNACGVLGGSETSWECVNTKVDLESCGGCMLPLPSASSLEPKGQDCTAIAGVSDVSCVGGSCVVHRCMPGFDISNDGTSCVERNEWAKFQVAEWM